MRTHYRALRSSQRGVVMPMALFALATLTAVLTGGLLVAGSGIRATRNYRGATQVHFVAESAIAHALQVVNGPGVVHLRNDVVTPWANVWGTGARSFAPRSGYHYTVVATADAANPANAGRLIATATGIEGVRNVVVANVVRSNVPSTSPGAIYLATDMTTNATFNGDSFTVTGNDTNFDNTSGPGAPVPGISTRNDRNTAEARSSITAQQADNVLGQGFVLGPPPSPSVFTSPAAPSVEQMNRMIDDLLARTSPPPDTYDFPQITGRGEYGTRANPKISHFTGAGGLVVRGAGNVTGAGIMIVEGNLTILGNYEFDGLILVRGQVSVGNDPLLTNLSGNAKIYGSVWTENLNLEVGGNAKIRYSTQALALANQVSGGMALPAPLKVMSIADCAEVGAGVGGCPG